jgi:hypothetical protein
MNTTGLAIFVFLAFLVPVPLIHWLDLPGRPADRPADRSPESVGSE